MQSYQFSHRNEYKQLFRVVIKWYGQILQTLQSFVSMDEYSEYYICSSQFKSHCKLRIMTQGIKSKAHDPHYHNPKDTNDGGL